MIRFRVTKLAQKIKLRENLRGFLQQRLLAVPNRTYPWIYLVFESLEDARIRFKKTQKGIDEPLKNLPETVYGAYEQILDRSTDQELTRRILYIILAAQRPLTLKEMNIAANIEFSPRPSSYDMLDLEDEADFLKTMRECCGLFVSVYQDRVQFLHQTAREFLLGSSSLDLPQNVPTLHRWRSSLDLNEALRRLV